VQQQQQDWQHWGSQLEPTVLKAAAVTRSDFLSTLTIVRSRAFAAPYISWPLSAFVPVAAALQALAAVAWLAVGMGAGAGVEVVGLAGVAAAASSSLKAAQDKEQHALCPLIDMFNHDSKVEVSGVQSSQCLFQEMEV
jgi:hypothetical protein